MSAAVKAGWSKLRIPLVLGSRSPRRLELLASVGIPVTIAAADVDESPHTGEAPSAYVDRIARTKLDRAVAEARAMLEGELAVLVADTTVTVDGDILGKPDSADHALQMLGRLVGRTHEVLTCYGIALLGSSASAPLAGQVTVRTVTTRVSMRPCARTEIEGYVASEEPFGKAGSYAIQGLGAQFVERIEGSYTGVVGLPVSEVVQDLLRLGVLEPGA